MILVPSGVRVWLAVGRTDMRKGMNGLALQVQEVLGRDRMSAISMFLRGARRADQDYLARRDRHVALREAARTWPIRGRHRPTGRSRSGGAAGLYAGRHRLAKPAAYLASGQCRIRFDFSRSERLGFVIHFVMDADLAALPDDIAALKAALAIERARVREVVAERDAGAAELAVARAKASEDLALIAHQVADRPA